ncbi:MAG: RloB domain-containing protein [Bacteroidaceae bacterium]|nr:RloB domain-containing protein [Bacteroidaceae bacterium]
MASKREPARSMRMRKIALVICEGETEVGYINLLKTWYKSPIRIVSHIEGTKITPSLVEKRAKELKISQWDKVHTFLMYDMDVQAINEKLLKCKAEMLLSNPCFEIWLLLHAKDQKAAIETDALVKELKKSAPVWKNYSKSAFTDTQNSFLNDKTDVAVERAKKLQEFQNPSTGIYKLIEMLSSDARMSQESGKTF